MVEEKAELRSGITAPFNKRLNEALQFNPQMPFSIGNSVTPSQLIGVLKGEQGTPGLPAAISAVKDDNNLILLATSPVERGELKLEQITTAGSVSTIVTLFTVPKGEKWILKNFSGTKTGTGTIDSFTLSLVNTSSNNITVFARGTATLDYNFPQQIVVPEGFSIRIATTISAWTSGNIVCNLLYQRFLV